MYVARKYVHLIKIMITTLKCRRTEPSESGWAGGDARKGTLPPSQMLAEYTKRFKQIERTYYFCLPLQIFRPSYDPDIDGYTALVKRIRKNTLWNAKCFFMLHYFKSYYTFYSLWHVSDNFKNIALSLNKLWPTLGLANTYKCWLKLKSSHSFQFISTL